MMLSKQLASTLTIENITRGAIILTDPRAAALDTTNESTQKSTIYIISGTGTADKILMRSKESFMEWRGGIRKSGYTLVSARFWEKETFSLKIARFLITRN